MSKPLFFFDTETSGLDPKRHTILQIAWIIEYDGAPLIERCFDVRPDSNDDLCLAALAVNDFTLERMGAAKERAFVFETLRQDLREAKDVQLIPVGHNVKFDIEFLNAAAQRGNDKYWLHFGNNSLVALKKALCTHLMCHYLEYCGDWYLPDYKLQTVCKAAGIVHEDAHDALADVRATRELFYYCSNRIRDINKG